MTVMVTAPPLSVRPAANPLISEISDRFQPAIRTFIAEPWCVCALHPQGITHEPNLNRSAAYRRDAGVEALAVRRLPPREASASSVVLRQRGDSTGGAGGDASVTVSNSASTFDPLTGGTGSILADGIGILARSTGGNGGVGHSHTLDFAKAGVDGGTTTGTGGTVTVTVDTNITLTGVGNLSAGQAYGAGVLAVSAGGNGGDGGNGSDFAPGGNGGFGGGGALGGTVNVTVTDNGSINAGTLSVPNNGLVGVPAIFAQSLGGYGGSGANGGRYTSGGDAGPGADGGAINVTNNGALTTSFSNSPGILAQSLGGAGANGGTGGGWGDSGGEGATGGDGGPITILGSGGSIGTPGTNSPGILAQSIGGGGGSGGDPTGWLALGGMGETGWVEV
ncbi:MAG: hypothetical protein AB7F35_24450 [Acetobacteraceae bacterium]